MGETRSRYEHRYEYKYARNPGDHQNTYKCLRAYEAACTLEVPIRIRYIRHPPVNLARNRTWKLCGAPTAGLHWKKADTDITVPCTGTTELMRLKQNVRHGKGNARVSPHRAPIL